ncbi:hypothetical protein EMIHUDRAFT_224080 [Emiliania huxleyi CCMP1516]|uniref:Uncharacterized protein n=2 Tax=Emiliania huxleyi TaxID=2903 RepID=A0A0D3KT40_EMIH1|nr:hypothetical protein EMIHUDRAFT_224080 [Emiliania huxleyi CCMP1516]EOD38925.1 hypothetical protein EMIHUDRAFT_224080 [Emiliania huxleyi CCMP1516]|eukprot:XP_005791354.1 hypothetical protein EMIHUDRAFT_224080 [Emiliania huxleyi CCMP1516]
MEVTEWRANGTIRKGRARRMEKETASRQRLLAISRHSPRTLATWEGFVKDGLKNIRTKKRRREEPAEDAAYALPIQGYHLDPSTGACGAVVTSGTNVYTYPMASAFANATRTDARRVSQPVMKSSSGGGLPTAILPTRPSGKVQRTGTPNWASALTQPVHG